MKASNVSYKNKWQALTPKGTSSQDEASGALDEQVFFAKFLQAFVSFCAIIQNVFHSF